MEYAKINPDGSVIKYPYSIYELRADHPNVSFPDVLTPESLADFDVVEVTLVPQPPFLYDKDLERTVIQNPDGSYAESWTYIDVDEVTIAERTEAQALSLRNERNAKLAASDWTQLPDIPTMPPDWKVYRQALRDLPNQAEFPWIVFWPVEPI